MKIAINTNHRVYNITRVAMRLPLIEKASKTDVVRMLAVYQQHHAQHPTILMNLNKIFFVNECMGIMKI